MYSEANRKATNKYINKNEANRSRANYLRQKSSAKTFIRHYADKSELEDLEQKLLEKKAELEAIADKEDGNNA